VDKVQKPNGSERYTASPGPFRMFDRNSKEVYGLPAVRHIKWHITTANIPTQLEEHFQGNLKGIYTAIYL
jgi:hypothetical protein